MHNHRMKCPATNKFVYDTKQLADRDMHKKIKAKLVKNPKTFHSYRCPYCEYWHLGHSKLLIRPFRSMEQRNGEIL